VAQSTSTGPPCIIETESVEGTSLAGSELGQSTGYGGYGYG